MAGAEAVFEESLFQALNVINLENVSERGDKEHCGFEECRNFFFLTCFGKSLTFQLFAFVFDSRHGSTDSFILVVSPL